MYSISHFCNKFALDPTGVTFVPHTLWLGPVWQFPILPMNSIHCKILGTPMFSALWWICCDKGTSEFLTLTQSPSYQITEGVRGPTPVTARHA